MPVSENRNGFIVREYQTSDYPSVIDLWTETGMANPARGDDENTIALSIGLGGQLLILEELASAKIAGTSWMTFDGRRIHLHHFGILPEMQGRKLSHFLLEESLAFARTKNCQVKLEVHALNTRAADLYKKHGFEYLGDYDVYIIRDISKV